VTVDAGLVSTGANRLLLPRVEITRDLHRRFAQRLDEILARPARLPIAAQSP